MLRPARALPGNLCASAVHEDLEAESKRVALFNILEPEGDALPVFQQQRHATVVQLQLIDLILRPRAHRDLPDVLQADLALLAAPAPRELERQGRNRLVERHQALGVTP